MRAFNLRHIFLRWPRPARVREIADRAFVWASRAVLFAGGVYVALGTLGTAREFYLDVSGWTFTERKAAQRKLEPNPPAEPWQCSKAGACWPQSP